MMRTFVERSLQRFTAVLQESVFAEETASQKGRLQQMDPRVKATGFFLLILSAAVSHSITVIAAIYTLSLILAAGARIFTLSFFRRIWVFMPLYTLLIALPALFLTPGNPFITLLERRLVITEQGFRTVLFLVLRVATSVSFLFLLVFTTSWPKLLMALRSLGVPRIAVFLFAMTYRYIYVLLQIADSLFLARKSRHVGPEARQSARQWIGTLLGTLLGKSYYLSNEVYLAMRSRGFSGDPVHLDEFRIRLSDAGWLLFFLSFAAVTFYFGYWRSV